MSSTEEKYRILAYTDSGDAYVEIIRPPAKSIIRFFDATLLDVDKSRGKQVEENDVYMAIFASQFIRPQNVIEYSDWDSVCKFFMI